MINLFNAVYITGNIPKQGLTSEFITFSKKNNVNYCSDNRTIALMNLRK